MLSCPVVNARVASLVIVEGLDVLEERGSGLAPRGEPCSVLDLGFERAEEAFHRRVVQAVALTAHGGVDAVEPEQLAIVTANVLGGFKRSSQHLDEGGCDGQTKACFRSLFARSVTLSWASSGDTTRRPRAVLGGDCSRTCERGGCGRCRSFTGCGSSVVS